jgi:GT2 family glycosyltransferase
VTALSVVVVTWRARELLAECLASVEAALQRVDGEAELVVVDNASGDGSVELVRERHPAARVVELAENAGFAGGVAAGIAASAGDWVALVNNDAVLEPDALARLLAAGRADARAGAVTAQVRFFAARDTINTAGLEIDKVGVVSDRLAGAPATDGGDPEEVFGASGCVSLYRRAMLDEAGGFDASFFAYGEDADLAWRARMRGWRTLYEPRALAYHHGSATARERSAAKYFLVGRNRMRMLAKNATASQLARWGAPMVVYDLAYVLFVALADRTLAPLRGRIAGLREWRAYRAAGAPGRAPAQLMPATGWLRALRQRAAYERGASGERPSS